MLAFFNDGILGMSAFGVNQSGVSDFRRRGGRRRKRKKERKINK